MAVHLRRWTAACLAALLGVQVLVVAPAGAADAGTLAAPDGDEVRLLVTYAAPVDGEREADRLPAAELAAAEDLPDALAQVHVLAFDDARDAARAARALARRDDVVAVEPDPLVRVADWQLDEVRTVQSTTSTSGGSWGVRNDGRTIAGQAGTRGIDVGAEQVWGRTTGREVVVAIIDSGVDVTHPLLRDRMWRNPRERVDGTDTDGNGFQDDVHGWNFVANSPQVFTSATADSHGTHVAGVVAGTAHAQSGYRSVAPGARIMALKFIDGETGRTSDAIRAIRYAVANGAHVINASWGGPEPSRALETELAATPIPVVVSAGNHGARLEETPLYPAAYDLPNLVAVAALDHTGALADYSGRSRRLVGVAAPGSRILSPFPDGRLAVASGTSAAAPHVSGVLALALQRHPGRDAVGLLQATRDAVRPLQSAGETRAGGLVRAPALLDHLGTPVPACSTASMQASSTFTDVATSNVHHAAVACLVSTGVTQGVSASQFGAARNLTRAQIATLVARAIDRTGKLPPAPATGRFTDVPATNVHRDAIETLAALGIVRGTTSTSFEPGRTVTRAELAAVTTRAAEYLTGAQVRARGPAFVDLAGHPDAEPIRASAGLRIVQGRSDGAFRPQDAVRRDQAASMVSRLLDRLAQHGVFEPTG